MNTDHKRMFLAEQSDLSDRIQNRLRCKGDDGPVVQFAPPIDFEAADKTYQEYRKRKELERDENYS